MAGDAWAREIDPSGRTLADRLTDTLADIRDIGLREDTMGEHEHDWRPVTYVNATNRVVALCRDGCTATFAVPTDADSVIIRFPYTAG